jgi:hypothetical protein
MSKQLACAFFVLCLALEVGAHQLERREFKGLAASLYLPGQHLWFDRTAADDLAHLRPDMIRMEFIGNPDDHRTIEFEAYDLIVEEAGKRGISILGLVAYQAFPVDYTSKAEWDEPSFRERYLQRLRDLVARYHDQEFGIRHWEIWNEPDKSVEGFDVRIEPAPYAEMLIAAYDLIKSIDPEATVLFGGISSMGFESDGNYLRAVYESEPMRAYRERTGRSPFDAVAAHPYVEEFDQINPGLGEMLLGDIKSVMNDFGDHEMKVWVTRLGWNSRELGIPGQARRLEQAYHFLESLTDPAHPDTEPFVERVFWFQYLNYEPGNDWGLRTADRLTRKASYFSYRALTLPGPDPGELRPGESTPVWGAKSPDELPLQVRNDDLLEGLVPEVLEGDLHEGSQGILAALTNGEFDEDVLTVLLADFELPSLHIRYTFPEPVDIQEVRSFAGHQRDWGNRAWQNIDVRVNGRFGVDELSSGPFGQVSNHPGGALSLVRWMPEEEGDYVATNVTTLELIYHPVSYSYQFSFVDPWRPKYDPAASWVDQIRDFDSREPAFVSTILKEIDVIGRLTPTGEQVASPDP